MNPWTAWANRHTGTTVPDDVWVIGPDLLITPQTFTRPLYTLDDQGNRVQTGVVTHPYNPLNPADFMMRFWSLMDQKLDTFAAEAREKWRSKKASQLSRLRQKGIIPWDGPSYREAIRRIEFGQ